jgi:hypothetical protein
VKEANSTGAAMKKLGSCNRVQYRNRPLFLKSSSESIRKSLPDNSSGLTSSALERKYIQVELCCRTKASGRSDRRIDCMHRFDERQTEQLRWRKEWQMVLLLPLHEAVFQSQISVQGREATARKPLPFVVEAVPRRKIHSLLCRVA